MAESYQAELEAKEMGAIENKIEISGLRKVDQMCQSRISELEQEVQEKSTAIAKLEKKYKANSDAKNSMRYDYLKDILHLREYVYLKENKQSVNDYVDARYFEASEGMDEHA